MPALPLVRYNNLCPALRPLAAFEVSLIGRFSGVPRGFSAHNEVAAHERGVKRVCIPSRNTKSAERKRQQKKRWFKQGQKWRTGCEGRISVLKRRHGLRRCIYRGDDGMRRWVGLGVIADNLHHLGTVLAERKK